MLWRSSLIGILENGLLLNIDFKQPSSWVHFSYKFSQTNENVEYIEREDEFDNKEEEKDDRNPIKLDKSVFDVFQDQSLGSILYQKKDVLMPNINSLQILYDKRNLIKEEDEDDDDDEDDDEEDEYDEVKMKEENYIDDDLTHREELLEKVWLNQDQDEKLKENDFEKLIEQDDVLYEAQAKQEEHDQKL